MDIDGRGNILERWLIDADGQHVWNDVEELHIIEGDTIDLPVSLQGDKLERNLTSFIRRVDNKLTGREFGEELSVSAQVQRLIEAATSHQNLCQCFVGWCPFW